MAKRLRRQRDSGALRQLPSGRWQPAILEVDNRYTSLGTFRTRGEAEKSLAAATADRHRGSWIDPRDGRVSFEAYSTRWLDERLDDLQKLQAVEVHDDVLGEDFKHRCGLASQVVQRGSDFG